MKDSKVVLIKGNQSEWFEQAIFIMKSPYEASSKDLLLEAERIINNYMNSGCASITSFKQIKHKGITNGGLSCENKKTAVLTPNTKAKTNPLNKNKIDAVTLLINLCLILCCILLGFLLHKIMS